MSPNVRLIRGFMVVGGWTMASRVVGFVRDVMIAAFVGTGPVAEAYFVASALPNMFRRFFAEGAFNAAFVPMFTKKLEAKEDARAFAEEAMSGLAFVVTIVSILSMLVMPWMVLAMASGFAGDERLPLAVEYGLICFPYILFISITALLSGVLNAGGRFVAAAAAPVLMNFVLIAAMLGAYRWGWNMGLAMSWSMPVAGVVQMVMCWWAAARMGFPLRLRVPRFSPEMRQLVAIAFPAVLAGGVVQINLLVGRQIASFYPDAIAWLTNADRLYQLPLGVIGIAVGIVLLPDLSRRLKTEDVDGSQSALSRGTEFALALTIPCSVALIVIAVPLISVLFQRGRFGPEAVGPTAVALAIYGAGLPAFIMHKILQPLFFARGDTKRPFRYAVHSMVVNAAAAVGLAYFIGFSAAAIGTTLAGWTMAAQLWFGSRSMGQAAQFDGRFWARIWRICLASALMGVALWGAMHLMTEMLATPKVRILGLALLVTFGAAVYGAIGLTIGAFRLGDIRTMLRRS